jgi:hypothetical protein
MKRADLEGMGESDEGLERFYVEQVPQLERDAFGGVVLRSYEPDTPDRQARRRRIFDVTMTYVYAAKAPT